MRMACYCRVSTEKEDQLNSLQHQADFFKQLAKNNNYKIYKIYADEGISGKQLKNRKEFLKMIADAEKKKFEIIYVKDVSRFARNTEDFLHSIRKIKSFGLNVYFVNHNMDIQEGSEFFLTILAAAAQEESSKLSSSIKFGKNITAKRGRVPNFVFGYDRIDKYTLKPNLYESEIVKEIFDLYVNKEYGMSKIASHLNDKGVITKRQKKAKWSQTVVGQILRNRIYIGEVVNKKEEVVDFITGNRRTVPESEQIVVEKPEFQIIDRKIFDKAQKIIEERRFMFKVNNKRPSAKYPFSNLLKCSVCGFSFRRCKRKYSENGKWYIWWTCSYRNSYGANMCLNKFNVDEYVLIDKITTDLIAMFKNSNIKEQTTQNIKKLIEERNKTKKDTLEVQKKLKNLIKEKEKYMIMYKEDIISLEELKSYVNPINTKINKLTLIINDIEEVISMDIIHKEIDDYFKNIHTLFKKTKLNNALLKKHFKQIIVSPDGRLEFHMKLSNNENIPPFVITL